MSNPITRTWGRLAIASLAILVLAATREAKAAAALDWISAAAPEGGAVGALAAFGDTVLAAADPFSGVSGPFLSFDGGRHWQGSLAPRHSVGIGNFLKVGN